MQKRGQVNAYFVYAVLAIIILGATILFGFSRTDDIGKTASKAQVLTLKSAISNDVALMSGDYGSVSVKAYHVPEGISKICFVDPEQKKVSAGLAAFHPIVKEGVEEGNNMFLVYDNGLTESFDVGKIEVQGPNSVCYQKDNGFIKVRLKGQGDRAEINEVFEKEIGAGQSFTFESLGVTVQNNDQTQPITVSISYSDSGLSDYFEILPARTTASAGPVVISMPIPQGYDCASLLLEEGNSRVYPICTNENEGIVSFQIDQISSP